MYRHLESKIFVVVTLYGVYPLMGTCSVHKSTGKTGKLLGWRQELFLTVFFHPGIPNWYLSGHVRVGVVCSVVTNATAWITYHATSSPSTSGARLEIHYW